MNFEKIVRRLPEKMRPYVAWGFTLAFLGLIGLACTLSNQAVATEVQEVQAVPTAVEHGWTAEKIAALTHLLSCESMPDTYDFWVQVVGLDWNGQPIFLSSAKSGLGSSAKTPLTSMPFQPGDLLAMRQREGVDIVIEEIPYEELTNIHCLNDNTLWTVVKPLVEDTATSINFFAIDPID